MSRARKHVLQEALAGEIEPPGPDQCIVRALGARGGNLVEVERPDKSTCMVLLPAKFRKMMWIKRGGFLIIRAPPEAAASGARLAGEVERVLYEQEVSELKKIGGVWPKEFEEEHNIGGSGAGATTAGAGGGAGGGGSGSGGKGPSGEQSADAAAAAAASGSDGDDSGLPPLEENPNRRRQTYATSSESDSEEEEEDEEEEEEEDEKR